MFNINVERDKHRELKKRLDALGVKSKVEASFTSNGKLYFDVAINADYEKINKEVRDIIESNN